MTKARDIASAIPAPSTVSSAELGYLDGVTSAIQTQVDAKTAKSTLTTTGDIYYASAANTPARLGIGSTDQVLKVTAGVPAWATPASSSPASATATVAADEGTTSGSFVDLTTAGPAVTLTTGTKVLVIVSAYIGNSGNQHFMDFAISGATTRAAADTTCLFLQSAGGRFSVVNRMTVTAGSNTFTAKYHAFQSNTAQFADRTITVIDLGS